MIDDFVHLPSSIGSRVNIIMNTFLFILAFISLTMILNNFLLPIWLRLGAIFSSRQKPLPSVVQKMSVILPVYNEEKQILKRLANVKEALEGINTPHEVLIGSDGSKDKTVELAREFIRTIPVGTEQCSVPTWKVFVFPNEGKGKTINKLVGQSTGDLVISSDADVSMEPSAIGLILKTFEEDDRIGGLSSVPTFAHEGKSTQSFYWDIEMKIREAQSGLGKLIVVTGWLYAFRKSLFAEIPSTAMADDLWVPLTILLQGFKCVHHKELKAFSEKTDEEMEVKRRERVISGGADIIMRLFTELLKKPGLFTIVFFHKINRWLLPVWCFLFVLSTGLLEPRILYFYGLLLLGLVVCLKPRRFWMLVLSVITPLISFFSLTQKKDISKWEHTRT